MVIPLQVPGEGYTKKFNCIHSLNIHRIEHYFVIMWYFFTLRCDEYLSIIDTLCFKVQSSEFPYIVFGVGVYLSVCESHNCAIRGAMQLVCLVSLVASFDRYEIQNEMK